MRDWLSGIDDQARPGKSIDSGCRRNTNASMANENLGLWIFGGAMAVCIVVALILTHLYPIPWIRERMLSDDRWTRVAGMLPIAFPVYLLAGLLFSYLRR
jgi:hypothetical protein